MARRKDTDVLPVPVMTCGLCAHAYGYCCPGHDGSPIACRCPDRPESYRMVSERACRAFSMRESPPPETVTERWSENRERDRIREKVVPLFRKGEKRPWKLVRVSEIPPDGISWDGTPYRADADLCE